MAQKTIQGIPLFQAVVDDDEQGMKKISLVDLPAVEKDFVAFEKSVPMRYAVQDEEKRLVFGVVMRANFPIYRESDGLGAYYIQYTPETIRVMAEKYLCENRSSEVNIQHEDGSDVEGCDLVQWFIKDTAKGVAPEGFDDIEDGSLFGEFHINNDDVWRQVKDGTLRGFSLEGLFGIVPVAARKQTKSNRNMKLSKIKEMLRSILAQFASITTDKAVLFWDGEDDIKVGDSVFTEDEEGNRLAAEDGDYKTDDGRIISVADGKVSAIEEESAEEPAEPAEEPAEQQMYKNSKQVIVENASATYDERLRSIVAAINEFKDVVGEWFYINSASDEQAVVTCWDENDNERLMRFDISFAEDGTATASNPTEVRIAYVPITEEPEEPESEQTEQENEKMSQMSTRIEELEGIIAELRKQPAAASAHEEFQQVVGAGKTGVKRLDKFAERYCK